MTTKELLACITPGANDYIQTTINTKNKADYQKLKKLFDKQQFEAKNFEDSELDILTFDWQSLERDRNWWWQLQALPFLNWYANSFSLQSDEERTRYLSLCLNAIHNWVNQAKQNKASPLVWHDHAAAFRVRNLTNWLVFCHYSCLPLGDESRAELLGSLIIEHLNWLQEDKHYSKHTNHGFDQAMIALTIASMFARDDFETYRHCNRERLKNEVSFAFTDEGVHKENSPGYQKMMLGRLKQLRTLAPLGEKEISQMGERYIEKAETFLRVVTLPNGYLPMIGDTRGGDKGLSYELKEQVDVLDYSASGYVIVRGKVLKKDFHLVFKASHLSHYHRHDDDLSIHLYYNGKNLLGDGGLGSHNEKDKKRIALRSYLSHNVPYLIDGKAARKVGELNGALPTVSLQDEKIVGKSFCYGAELTREIDISRLQDGKLTIRDSVDESSGQPFAVNFFSSEGLYVDGESLLVSVSDNKSLRISSTSPVNAKSESAYISKEFSKFSGAAVVTISHGDKRAGAIEFEIDINYPKQVLHEVVYRGFGPIQLLEAGDWFFDDDYPGNVCHHVMSLRWLGEVKSPSTRARILRSFIAYHGSNEKRHSRYYLGRTADHTTSIRLAELLAAIKGEKTDVNLKSLLRRELAKNIRACLKDTYKENNNHGLMVDKAILLCLIKDKWLLEKFSSDVSFVISRVEKQLNGIFDEEGYCKEHSTSYQEYNLGIAIDLLDVMESGRGLGFDTHIDELKTRVEKIKVASRKALGFLLKGDGTYVTVGDSFPQPKPDILEKAFGSRDPKTALRPESEQHGVFYNKTLGVSVYRDSNIHLVLNASWHSYVHKQNDDLNIFLRVHGEDVFVEGGYSDIVSSKEIDTKSECLHSTVTVPGKSWLSRGDVRKGFSFISAPESEEDSDSVSFFGEHTRINGCSVKRWVRIEPAEGKIKINDRVEPVEGCLHRFVVPKNVTVEIGKSECRIFSQDSSLKICFNNGKANGGKAWELSDIEVIKNNALATAHELCAISSGEGADFLLTYEPKSPKACASLGALDEYQVDESLRGVDFKVITKSLYSSRRAEVFGVDYDFVNSLVGDAYCHLLLRARLTRGVLVLCQHFNNVALIDVDKRKIFPVSGASESKALAAADDFFNLSAELVEKVALSLSEAAIIEPVSDKPVRLYCSYSRPYHYFVDFFSRASELYRRGEKVAFLTHPKEEFFEVSEISSDTLVISEDLLASNTKMLDEGVLAMRPVKDLIKPNFEVYHAWSVDMARKINKENGYLEKTLREISGYKFKVWLSVCSDGRAWIEQEEGVEKIISKINKEAGGEAVFLLDSFTRTIGFTRGEFNGIVSEEAFRYVEDLCGHIQESLGGSVLILNLTGMSSSEKLVIASEIDFYVGNFLTDSMYPCRFNAKPGVGFGANVSSHKSHHHPNTEIVPGDKVLDIDPSASWARVSYSINPGWLSVFCLNHFKDRCVSS